MWTDARGEYELRRVLDFILNGGYTLASRALSCSQRKASAMYLRIRHHDVLKPDAALAHAFENTTQATGDAVWEIVKGIAPKFGYTRREY